MFEYSSYRYFLCSKSSIALHCWRLKILSLQWKQAWVKVFHQEFELFLFPCLLWCLLPQSHYFWRDACVCNCTSHMSLALGLGIWVRYWVYATYLPSEHPFYSCSHSFILWLLKRLSCFLNGDAWTTLSFSYSLEVKLEHLSGWFWLENLCCTWCISLFKITKNLCEESSEDKSSD